MLAPHTHTPAPTARGWRTPTARPVGVQSGEGQRLTSDAPHNGGRHPLRGRPSGTPTASNAGPQGRTLWALAGFPCPHRPHPGQMGRGTSAARSRGRAVGWLVGWLLLRCPSARPGPPRPQATGGRGCVTRCMSHVPRALGLARAALARSRSAPSPVSGTSGSTALRAVPCLPAPMLCVVAAVSLPPPPPALSVVCPWCAPWFRAGARRLGRPGAFRVWLRQASLHGLERRQGFGHG